MEWCQKRFDDEESEISGFDFFERFFFLGIPVSCDFPKLLSAVQSSLLVVHAQYR